MRFAFEGLAVVEATSEEDALNKLGARIKAVARHLGNGEPLGAANPFFTLTKTDEPETPELFVDPIVEAAQADPPPPDDEPAAPTEE